MTPTICQVVIHLYGGTVIQLFLCQADCWVSTENLHVLEICSNLILNSPSKSNDIEVKFDNKIPKQKLSCQRSPCSIEGKGTQWSRTRL